MRLYFIINSNNIDSKTKDKEAFPMKQDLIVVLDLGSTRNTVVARAIRELGV